MCWNAVEGHRGHSNVAMAFECRGQDSIKNLANKGVTAHWLDDNFSTQNKCLIVHPALGSHTANHI